MKPTIKPAATNTPDSGEMVLYQHDRDFSIKINGHELMNSRQHEKEIAYPGGHTLSGTAKDIFATTFVRCRENSNKN